MGESLKTPKDDIILSVDGEESNELVNLVCFAEWGVEVGEFVFSSIAETLFGMLKFLGEYVFGVETSTEFKSLFLLGTLSQLLSSSSNINLRLASPIFVLSILWFRNNGNSSSDSESDIIRNQCDDEWKRNKLM